MSWMNDTYDQAVRAATKYYDEVLVRDKMFPGELRRLPKERSEAILQLADDAVGQIREKFPENTYDDNSAKILSGYDANKMVNWLYGQGVDPIVAKRQEDFNALQELVNPDAEKGQKSWMQMSNKELEHKMQQFGFDSRVKGDFQKFLDMLRQHQTNFDRAQVVQKEINEANPFEKFALAMFPTATNEAIRQSLTGDFDDGAMNRTLGTDMFAQALFGAGTLSKNLMMSPLRIGAYDAGVELGRQGINAAGGFGFDPLAPIGAGVAAATVPAGAQWLGGFLAKGGNMSARPFARGFQRGLRGADDPLRAERDNLKKILIDTRKESQAGATTPTQYAEVNGQAVELPRQADGSIAGIESALLRDDAKQKLMALGFRSAEEEQALATGVARAQEKFEKAKQSLDQVIDAKGTVPEASRQKWLTAAGERADAAQKELEEAQARNLEYQVKNAFFGSDRRNYPYVEQVIGGDPEYGQAMPGMTMNYSVENVLKNYYDKPVNAQAFSRTGKMSPHNARDFEGDLGVLKATFPEKYSAEAAMGSSKNAYKNGIRFGRVVGSVGTQIEPNLKANPFQPDTYADKVTRFMESDWFKSLPKQKKMAIERALKGEK